MAGFLAALRYVHLPSDVTDNTEMSQHVLVWWSERLFHAVLSTERKTLLCPGCRSFQVHLLGEPELPIPVYLFFFFGLGSFIHNFCKYIFDPFSRSSPSGTSVIY